MKPRVFVSRPLLPAAIERIAEHCEVAVNPEDVALKPGALAEACRDVDGLVACGVRVNEEVLRRGTRLRGWRRLLLAMTTSMCQPALAAGLWSPILPVW